MKCDYCGEQMPESYSYEVGGVVECNQCFKERTTTPEEKLHARIAELEQQLAEAKEENKKLIMLTRKLMG